MIRKNMVSIRIRLSVEIPSETKRKMDEMVKRERDKQLTKEKTLRKVTD